MICKTISNPGFTINLFSIFEKLDELRNKYIGGKTLLNIYLPNSSFHIPNIPHLNWDHKHKCHRGVENAITMSLICSLSIPKLLLQPGWMQACSWTERRGDNIYLKISAGLTEYCRNSLAFQGLMNHLGGNLSDEIELPSWKLCFYNPNSNVYNVLNLTDVYSNNMAFVNI